MRGREKWYDKGREWDQVDGGRAKLDATDKRKKKKKKDGPVTTRRMLSETEDRSRTHKFSFRV